MQAPAHGEEFAQPPEWPDRVKAVFFDDAHQALSGEQPTASSETIAALRPDRRQLATSEVWRELISAEAMESAVKLTVNRLAKLLQQPARFKAGLHSDCRRDLTLLGTLFEIIHGYPDDVRWKATAFEASQMCLRSAEACAAGSDESREQAINTLMMLEDLMRGQAGTVEGSSAEPLAPDFAPLMQAMELVSEDELPTVLSKRTQFRRNAVSVGEKAQLLAALSHVIRGEPYGYADDETYRAHADRLRDAAHELNVAATAEEFDQAAEAAAAIQKACVECHADYRG